MKTGYKALKDEAQAIVYEDNLKKEEKEHLKGDDTGSEGEPLLSEESVLLNKVVNTHKEINVKKPAKLTSEEMDSALSDVKMTESKVGFFKRGKRQENYEKRADYEKEYTGFYDNMVVESESQSKEIMSAYREQKGSATYYSNERKTPYLALRMKQLKEMGEYTGEVDTAEFMQDMDVKVDDQKLTPEEMTNEGRAALMERRNKKVKQIEKIGDFINSLDIKSFEMSSPEAILQNKEKLRKDLTKLQLCEEFDFAIRDEYPKLKERGCECKYTKEELAGIQARTMVFMDISQLYTAYLRIADNPYFARVLDDELDGLDDATFQNDYKTKRYIDLMDQGYTTKQIEADPLYKYYTCLNFIRNIKSAAGSMHLGDDPVAAVEEQKKKLMQNG